MMNKVTADFGVVLFRTSDHLSVYSKDI